MTDVPTLSGNEITDATRRNNTQGDGLLPEQGSTGIWEATTNLITNGGLETNATGWGGTGSITTARVTTLSKFGLACAESVLPGSVSNEGPLYGFSDPTRIAVSATTT